MQVENVTGVSLTTWRMTEKKRHLAVGHSLLGQIVIDDEGVLAVVTEPLAHCASREWSEVLERGGLRSSSGNNDGVFHRVVLLEGLDKLCDS